LKNSAAKERFKIGARPGRAAARGPTGRCAGEAHDGSRADRCGGEQPFGTVVQRGAAFYFAAMPWKIVNLDYAARPHLHLKDPNAPIHLRAFFEEQRVEIGLGADDPEDCYVRATVTPDDVVVHAVRFEPLHVQILTSILASLDVEPGEREDALAWMQDQLADRRTPLRGNVDAFPPPAGWPYDLTDDALLDSLADREGAPHTRVSALLREARRRGLAVAGASTAGPEVLRRRPPRQP
jgi:hypothetical protein